jgi:hypothetical protein
MPAPATPGPRARAAPAAPLSPRCRASARRRPRRAAAAPAPQAQAGRGAPPPSSSGPGIAQPRPERARATTPHCHPPPGRVGIRSPARLCVRPPPPAADGARRRQRRARLARARAPLAARRLRCGRRGRCPGRGAPRGRAARPVPPARGTPRPPRPENITDPLPPGRAPARARRCAAARAPARRVRLARRRASLIWPLPPARAFSPRLPVRPLQPRAGVPACAGPPARHVARTAAGRRRRHFWTGAARRDASTPPGFAVSDLARSRPLGSAEWSGQGAGRWWQRPHRAVRPAAQRVGRAGRRAPG